METQTQSQLELEIVDFGDAKEQTKGIPDADNTEDNPHVSSRL